MPRTSLSALEILLRQTREDVELQAYPEVRRNLLTFIRALQRQDLDQGLQDIAVGRVLNRRFMLLLVPSGGLKSSEAMGLVVRVEEQNAKANSALRRRVGRVSGGGFALWMGARKQLPTRRNPPRDEQEQEAGEPAGVEDNGGDGAAGGS